MTAAMTDYSTSMTNGKPPFTVNTTDIPGTCQIVDRESGKVYGTIRRSGTHWEALSNSGESMPTILGEPWDSRREAAATVWLNGHDEVEARKKTPPRSPFAAKRKRPPHLSSVR